MSWSKLVYLYCDPCNDSESNADYRTEPFRVDPSQTVTEERRDAALYGWHYAKGRDICPSCWKSGAR